MNYVRTGVLLAALTALFMAVGYMIGGPEGMVIAFVIAVAMNLFSYWRSDSLVLSMYGAQEVDERTAPELVGLVRELSTRAGLPMPRVYLMDNPQPNAFATGRNPNHAAVAATTGLLQMLNARELAGVIAHELGHIRNRDTLTMTLTATIAGAISMLAQFGMMFAGGRRDGGNRGGGVGALLAVLLGCWPRCWCRWRSAAVASTPPTEAARRLQGIRSGLSPRSARSTWRPVRSRTYRPNSTR